MIFINNKYHTWYYNIIANAQSRNLKTRGAAKKALGYVEKHHIIPKCLFKENTIDSDPQSPDNLVFITAKEHFVCHHLLTKMTTGRNLCRMQKALSKMTCVNGLQERYKITARLFEQIRIASGKAHSILIKGTQVGENSPNFGKKRSKETINKMKAAKTGQNKGSKRTDATKAAISTSLLGVPKSIEHCSAVKESWVRTRDDRVGKNHPMFGAAHTDETVKKMEESSAKRWSRTSTEEKAKSIAKRQQTCLEKYGVRSPSMIPFTCEHCSKIVKGESNFIRYHGSNCKSLKR